MDADLLTNLKKKLPASNDRKGLERLSKASDVPYHTLLKIAKGETSDPRISTVARLQRALGIAS